MRKVEPVEEVFNAYIYLEGEWREMIYPHPAFEIKPQGELGATIQSFYIVFGIPKDKISQAISMEAKIFWRIFIITTNPGCLMKFIGLLQKVKKKYYSLKLRRKRPQK